MNGDNIFVKFGISILSSIVATDCWFKFNDRLD